MRVNKYHPSYSDKSPMLKNTQWLRLPKSFLTWQIIWKDVRSKAKRSTKELKTNSPPNSNKPTNFSLNPSGNSELRNSTQLVKYTTLILLRVWLKYQTQANRMALLLWQHRQGIWSKIESLGVPKYVFIEADRCCRYVLLKLILVL